MINFSVIVGIAMVFFGIGYLILTKRNCHKAYSLGNNSELKKFDEELNVLDSIIYRAKLKNQGKSIDEVLENLRKNNIKINFMIDCGEKNERY